MLGVKSVGVYSVSISGTSKECGRVPIICQENELVGVPCHTFISKSLCNKIPVCSTQLLFEVRENHSSIAARFPICYRQLNLVPVIQTAGHRVKKLH
jgi:hypothetical protein